MNNIPPSLNFTQVNQINTQAVAEENKLQNQGQTVYNQEMTASKNATVAGNQETQQSNAADKSAGLETQKALTEAKIMATTGSSGTLYQGALSGENKIFGFNPSHLAQTQELQNQTTGEASTAINQIDNVMGGNRGLSATGVQAKVRQISTQSNNLETNLGQLILSQQTEATTAETQASKKSSTEFKSEQLSQQSYKDSAAQYLSQANTYANAAKSEYNSSTNYAIDAKNTMTNFMIASLQVANTALKADQALTTKTYNTELNQEKSYINSEKVMQIQKNSFNQSQNKFRLNAQKALNKRYANKLKVLYN